MACGLAKNSNPQHPLGRAAFTLVELLVSVGIIVLLVALLLPVLSSAREQARAALCMSHERQLWQGWLLFAADHDNRLPGNLYDCTPAGPIPPPGSNPATWDWLAGWAPLWYDSYSTAPQKGTIFPYLGQNYQVYRCPSLEEAIGDGYEMGPQIGSNGRFDYVAFTTFAGCRLDRVPHSATFMYTDGTSATLPTPIISEEEAGTLNGSNMEGAHAWLDQMGHQHRGGCHYCSPDGSVHWFAEPTDACALNWFVQATHQAAPFSMGIAQTWGTFEGR